MPEKLKYYRLVIYGMTNLFRDIYKRIVTGARSREIDCRMSAVPWNEIDPKIKPLVKALNLRYSTFMCCEGHLNNTRFDEPYVDLSSDQTFDALNECLEAYNAENRIEWMLLPLPPHGPRLKPDYEGHKLMDDYERETDPRKKENLKELVIEKMLNSYHPSLGELQNSANNLARYLESVWR